MQLQEITKRIYVGSANSVDGCKRKVPLYGERAAVLENFERPG